MDKFILASVLILVLVEALCVVSLFTSDWIVSDYAGQIRHGLYLVCQTPPGSGDDEVCVFQHQHPTWTVCSLLTVTAVGVLAISISLLAVSLKRDITTFATVGKWITLMGLMLLCLVGILFPLGFESPEFGGQSYLLIPTFQAGYSYVLFNAAILLGMAALFVANKMFWPFCVQFVNEHR